MRYRAIVMGVSLGGMEALNTILPVLRDDLPVPVIVVQHLDPHSESTLASTLCAICRISIKEAEEKELAAPGIVYLAPANYHLLIESDGTFSLSLEDKVNYARPSIDVLFESAADAFGPALIGVVLTGASSDGSKGLKRIKENGGLAVVQDPDTAKSDIMPRSAIATTEVDHILPLEEIGNFLNSIVRGIS
jgi:two-component system chemotaxis response regulator CheB